MFSDGVERTKLMLWRRDCRDINSNFSRICYHFRDIHG